jgi:hypothetical protein
MKPSHRIAYGGHQWTFRELGITHGISPTVIAYRYKRGKRGEELIKPMRTYYGGRP